jgi:uncharacterized membrane protein
MHYGGWYPFAGSWLVGFLVFAAFVVLIVAGIAWILRRDARPYAPPPPPTMSSMPPRPDSALQILRERFARGEISEADYLAASRVLGAPEPPTAFSTDRTPGPPAT